MRAVDVLGSHRRKTGLARGSDVAVVDRRARAANGGPARLRLLSLALVGHAGCQALLPGLHLLLGRLRRSLSRCGCVLGLYSAFTTVQRNQDTGHIAEPSCCGRRLELQLVNDGREQLLTFLGELAVPLQTQGLPQETQSGHQDDFLSVDADREAKATLVEKLQNLDDVLARVRHG